METLLFFGFWAAVMFLMMRRGCGSHAIGHRSSQGVHEQRTSSSDGADANDLRWVPPERDKDPVCGKTVRTADARPSVYDGRVFYFCSRECREVFEAAPHLHVGGPEKTQSKQLEASHE